MSFKPLLAPREDPMSYPSYFKELKYPLLCSPKYDGVRCLVKNGVALSRTGKAIPSIQVQEQFSTFEHLDGELIVGSPTDFNVYNRTQSHVMSQNKFAEDLHYYVFDYTEDSILDLGFEDRLELLSTSAMSLLLKGDLHDNIKYVSHSYIKNEEELLEYERQMLELGFEGIMLRSPSGRYKNNRGTFKEGIIYKLKRFTDAEAVICDFKEQMINNNTQERDELGYSKRATFKENMQPANTLGAFLVVYDDDIIEVAPGNFNHSERKEIWDNREAFIGKILKFRFFLHGIKDRPRFPRATGLRDEMDM